MSVATSIFGPDPKIENIRGSSNKSDNKSTPSGFNGTIESSIFKDVFYHDKLTNVMKYINKDLFNQYAPDINGYTLTFMILPEFAGLSPKLTETYRQELQRKITFQAVDCTPPVINIENERINSRTGGIPYATEVLPTETITITFIDNNDLDLFNYHSNWSAYIKHLTEGITECPREYLDYEDIELYGALDYAASIFVVRYDTDMETIKYVGKCTGIFPQSIPNKEIIGQRASNELTTFGITYNCAYYEETVDKNHPIWKELTSDVLTIFS